MHVSFSTWYTEQEGMHIMHAQDGE